MKKYLGIMVLALLLLLPLGVHASSGRVSCVKEGNIKTCTVSYTATVEINKVNVTISGEGGATIKGDSITATSNWNMGDLTIGTNSYSFSLEYNSPENFIGTDKLFTYKYEIASDASEGECKSHVDIGGVKYTEEVKEEEVVSTPTGKCVKENGKYYINGEEVTKEAYDNECSQTGSTVPYIALIGIALLAGGAYVATKNKTKMYRL